MFLTLLALALLALIALPIALEARRSKITPTLREAAPGHFADLPRGSAHYIWHGPVRAPIIVLVHGLSSPQWVFDGLTRGLVMAGFRVLTYDLYGRGLSDRPRGAQTLAFHSEQLQALLEALEIDVPVNLLGYSMGGAIAARFAADHPGKVSRLILLAPAGLRYAPGRLLSAARKGGPLGAWLWGLFGGSSLRRSARRDAKAPTVLTDLPQRINAELSRRGYLGAILSSERHALHVPMEEVHREIAATGLPTLAIWGERDPVIPLAASGDLARLNRQAFQEVIAGAGHGLPYANPAEVLAAIREFLREVPA
ncbi:MAG TPA: alpha/beta hydrolase [Rhodobacterales bacterium]|nr:alpha/beta hydrolase [Rhodobacterales bacterium]